MGQKSRVQKKRKELREGAQFPGHKNYLSLKKNNNKKKTASKTEAVQHRGRGDCKN